MKIKNIVFASVVIPFLMSNSSIASPVLWISDVSGNLGTVDVGTQATTVVGNMHVQMSDIAFDGNGNLYGISLSSLYSIDYTTAAATFIGNHNINSTGNKNSLVFDANGNLYAANTALYALDINTGASSLLGSGGGYNSSGDLAFIGGDMYLSSQGSTGGDRLFEINTTTGVGSIVGNIGFSAVYGLATDDNVNLYGVAGTSILSIDEGSGLGTYLFNYAGHGLGMAWGSAFYSESSPVPEPATMLMFGMGLLGLAGSRLRKK